MGSRFDDSYAKGTIRISFGKYDTKKDTEGIALNISNANQELKYSNKLQSTNIWGRSGGRLPSLQDQIHSFAVIVEEIARFNSWFALVVKQLGKNKYAILYPLHIEYNGV